MQQAVLVACLQSFSLFLSSYRTQLWFRATMLTFQAENHDNPVPTFPASLAPRSGHVIQFWSRKYKKKSTEALRKFVAFLIKGKGFPGDSVLKNPAAMQETQESGFHP